MSAFSFMETSFFISLGITFVLILLLVYHFKQRLSVSEGKQDTMFEIINNLAQELANVKSVVISNNRPSTPYPHHMVIPPNSPLLSDNIKQVISERNDEDEDSDYEDSDDDDSDDDDSDDDDSDNEKIIVSDVDEDDDSISVEVVQINKDAPNCEVIDDVTVDDVIVDVTQDISAESPKFAKMNLGALKSYITEKGWVEDASKMKKAQIIELIESNNA